MPESCPECGSELEEVADWSEDWFFCRECLYTVRPEFDSILAEEEKLAKVEGAVRELEDPSTNQISRETDISGGTARKRFEELEERGRIEMAEKGQADVWRIALNGEDGE